MFSRNQNSSAFLRLAPRPPGTQLGYRQRTPFVGLTSHAPSKPACWANKKKLCTTDIVFAGGCLPLPHATCLDRNLFPEQICAYIRCDRSGGRHQQSQACDLDEVKHGALMQRDQRRSRSQVCLWMPRKAGAENQLMPVFHAWTNQRSTRKQTPRRVMARNRRCLFLISVRRMVRSLLLLVSSACCL